MTTEPAVEGDTLEEEIASAPSVESLHEMRPSPEEAFQGTAQSKRWYNTAPYTAASIFIEAAKSSDEFRRDFLNEDRFVLDEEYEPVGEGWSSTMEEACPELHRQLNELGLSSFQGGQAESMAQEVLQE